MFLRHSHYKVYLILALVIVIVTCAFFVRFYRLADIGFWDDDSLNYSSVTKKWFFEKNFTDPYAKPAYHLLGCLAISLVGFYDFTLLYLNNFLDVLTVVLIILIARAIGIRWILSVSAAMLYAFLPFILKEATRALPHLPSSTFFLIAFVLFLSFLNSSRRYRILLFLCGFSAVFAVGFHPTLLSGIAFFFLVLLGFAFPQFNSKEDRLKGIKDLFVYLLGCIMAYSFLNFVLSIRDHQFWERVMEFIPKLAQYRGVQYQGHQGNVFSKLAYTFSMAPEILTRPVSFLFALIALSGFGLLVKQWVPFSWDKIKKEWSLVCINKKSKMLCLLIGVMAFFLLSFIVAIRGIQARFMIPVVPLVILACVGCVDAFCCRYPKLRLGLVFFVFSVAIAAFNVGSNIEMIKKPSTASRQIANVLYHKVDARSRVLVAPSGLHQSRLETGYLDGNFVYHTLRPWRPKLEILKKFNIRYVVIVKPASPYVLANQNEEILNMEYDLMLKGISDMKARPLYESDKVVIFEILPYTPVANSSFRPPFDYPFFWVARLYGPVQMKE